MKKLNFIHLHRIITLFAVLALVFACSLVANAAGAIDINEGTSALPRITNAPVSQSIPLGQNVTFAIGVSSPTAVHYRWFFNEVAITNQTNATLALNAVTFSNAGFYLVQVSNADGSIRSTPVELAVRGTAARPAWEWVKTVYGYSSTVATDPGGNVYWCGQGLGDFGGFQIPTTGMFLAKINAEGLFDWVRLTGATPTPISLGPGITIGPGAGFASPAIAIDSASNIIVVGGGWGLNISGTPLTGEFAAKLDPTGSFFLWTRRFEEGYPFGFPASVAVDQAGNIYATSTFQGYANLENLFVYGGDAVMLKLSPAGSPGWINQGGSPSDQDFGLTVSVDVQGNSYFGGTYNDYISSGITNAAYFGQFLTAPEKGGYLAKYSPDGEVQWLQTLHGPGTPLSISGSTVLPNGNVMVLGLFKGSAVLGSTILNGDDSYTSAFIAELDAATGSVLTSQVLGLRVADDIAEVQNRLFIVSAADGSVRIAGYFVGTLTFGTNTIAAVGNSDIFVASISSSGAPLWIKTVGSPLEDKVTGLAYDGLGHTYVCGFISGNAQFDQQTVTNQSPTTAFLAKIDEGTLAPPTITNAPASQIAYYGGNVIFAVGVSSTTPVRYQWFFNNVAIAGQTNGTLTLNSVTASNAGSYFVEVTNADGSIRSTPVELVIRGDAPVHLTTLAGTNIAGYKNATGIEARFNQPNSPAITFDGNIIVPENGNNLIRIVEPDGFVGTYAGNTNVGLIDGSAADALFHGPLAVAIHPSGDIFVADTYNYVIRRISAFGARRVTTYAGSGVAGDRNGSGTNAQFNFPNDLVFDSDGNLFICEFHNHTIRKIDPNANVTTFAGSGTAGSKDGTGAAATFNQPAGIAVDKNNNLFVTEWTGQRIRKITPAGVVTTLVGSDTAGFVDGPSSSALLNTPDGITLDPAGNIYFTEFSNNSVRRLDTAGNVTTLAGLGRAGFQDGDRTTALLSSPGGIAWYPNGSLIIADTGNHAIRRLDFLTNTPPASATLVVNLHPGLTVFGTVGKTYRIDAAENSHGVLDWVSVGTVTLVHPVELWFDSEPASRAQRFYRAVEVP